MSQSNDSNRITLDEVLAGLRAEAPWLAHLFHKTELTSYQRRARKLQRDATIVLALRIALVVLVGAVIVAAVLGLR